jgi:dCTP deaminase
MTLLTDEELYDRVAKVVAPARPLVEPVPTNIANWFDKSSPVQPSSMDLSIGNIYVPGKTNRWPMAGLLQSAGPSGNDPVPYDNYVLKTGQTVIIVTEERLVLPSDIAAIGFPPSHVSINGLLMTNPGHVDPGYEGPMHLTVINMAKEPFALRKGDAIVTVLFFKLESEPRADWQARNGKPAPARAPTALARLSSDFVNVELRAKLIARRTLATATLLSTVIAAVITFLGSQLSQYYSEKPQVEQLRQDQIRLEQSVDRQLTMEKRIEELDHRLTVVEGRTPVPLSEAVPRRKK